MLGKYDIVLESHLQKVKAQQLNTKSKGPKKKVGRGSTITFLSKTSQNKLVDIIGNLIVSVIVDCVRDLLLGP